MVFSLFRDTISIISTLSSILLLGAAPGDPLRVALALNTKYMLNLNNFSISSSISAKDLKFCLRDKS